MAESQTPTDIMAAIQQMLQQQREEEKAEKEKRRKEKEEREERLRKEKPEWWEEARIQLREEFGALHGENRKELKKLSENMRTWTNAINKKQQEYSGTGPRRETN